MICEDLLANRPQPVTGLPQDVVRIPFGPDPTSVVVDGVVPGPVAVCRDLLAAIADALDCPPPAGEADERVFLRVRSDRARLALAALRSVLATRMRPGPNGRGCVRLRDDVAASRGRVRDVVAVVITTLSLTRFDGHPSSGVCPGRMSDHGEHGEEAPAPPFVYPGVQGRDRRAVPARRPVRRPGREGLRPDRDRGARVGQAGRTGRRDAQRRRPDQHRAAGAGASCAGRTGRLREDVEILKRATAFFAKETR